jgi:uncharacterized protein YjlB
MNPNCETYLFHDDGTFPNSSYPVVIYRSALDSEASEIEQKFKENQWSNSWRDTIYSFHHYHSITHEVMGVIQGHALLQLGGPKGKKLEVKKGDVIIIPAGVAHKLVESWDEFQVVGAYPGGRSWDILKGEHGERPAADKDIAKVPRPEKDPLLGADRGLRKIWVT